MEGPVFLRLVRAASQLESIGKAKWAAVVCVLLSALLAVPWPYKVRCDCTVEPVVRRYVAAPFNGTLDQALARPGEVVGQGMVLARLDGRELTWERASVESDHGRAEKRRDAAFAARNYAEAEIAKLEIERLAMKMQLLDHRVDHLEVRSPIDGVVTSGDLERAQGAPVELGQTLFEVAPLDRMIVEVAVPQREIAHVAAGQSVLVRLDALPQRSWELELERVQPRSELRDHDNVFLAEVSLNNADGSLRPGMDGRAAIVTRRRSLAWIVFHKPWESLLMWWGS